MKSIFNTGILFIVISKATAAILPYLFALCLSTSASAFQAQNSPPNPPVSFNENELEHLADSLANFLLERQMLSGLSIAVAKDNQLLFSKGYGKADLELDVEATAENIYRIGSVTKQFTAAAILKLAEEGKISLEDPITKYLPDYPTQGHVVRIRHLLNHTSGIKGIRARMVEEETRQKFRLDLSDEEINALFADAPFDFAPGEGQKYSNSGYLLLGQIISKVTGMKYKDYLEQNFFKAFGLENTGFDNEKYLLKNRAKGYEKEKEDFINAPFIDMDMPGSAGALYSTVTDLVQWTHLLHSGKVVSAESYEQMLSPTTYGDGQLAGYGYGLSLGELGNYKKVYHGGMINGFTAMLSHYPTTGITIAILTNTGGVEAIATLEKKLAKKALGIKILDLPIPQKEILSYSGTYAYKSGEKEREMKIFGDNGHLMAQVVGGKPFKLLSQAKAVFIPQVDEDMKIIFKKNTLEIHDGPYEKMIARKINE